MTPVRTVARALLASIFVKSGWDAIRNPDRLVDPAKPLVDKAAPVLDAIGLPTDPRAVVRLQGAAEVTGGILLATGAAPRVGAAVLAGLLVPNTLAGHAFWETHDASDRARQQTQFLKNLGLFGGLLLAAVDTAGRPGLAWRAGHAADHAQHSLRRSARSAKRSARSAKRETRRAAAVARRGARTTARETRLAVRAAKLGHRLP
jgi:uncharacterized membrane protein YphA (DoxX/SURF4 family)